jgi:holliday junction DNA helicase RuvA
MIGYLKGVVLFIEEDVLVLDVGGVGYEVHPTLSALSKAGVPGDDAELLIHTLVREDELKLFGFASREERALFLMLMQVKGVGYRLALLIISQMGDEGFVEAVLSANPVPLTRIKGIGKRTAERVILEMKDQVSKIYSGGSTGGLPPPAHMPAGLVEVQQALLGLGFRHAEVTAVLATMKELKGAAVEELIREALMRMRR